MKTTKSYKDMTKQERRAAAQAKAQAALDRIGDGVRSVWESEEWAKWLRTLAKFHDYSLNNTMLIAMQMPEATRVASYRSWQRDFGRHVRRGERGIEVLVPMVVKRKEADSGGFRKTTGRPPSAGGSWASRSGTSSTSRRPRASPCPRLRSG